MIFGVILAGGTGSRMQSSKLPKQFVLLGKLSILQHTVDKFLCSNQIDHIIVATHPTWMLHTKEVLSEDRYEALHFSEGGSTRQESLYKALLYIKENFKETEDAIIISHDVARPFVTLRIIEENIQKCSEYEAVDTVIPAVDTIVQSINKKTILNIPNRSEMYLGQTPQSFKLSAFLKIYESLDETYLSSVTDAARILVEHGCTVGLVEGELFNMKITNDYDFHIAQYLLGIKNHD